MANLSPHFRDIILQYPITLMEGNLRHFLGRSDKLGYRFKHISEIGTFCGGTAHLLAQHYPRARVHTVDLNEWDTYFRPNNPNESIRTAVQHRYQHHHNLHIDIPEQIPDIQEFYSSINPNLTFHTKTLDLTGSDLIVLDGDHTTTGVQQDFLQIQEQAPYALLICDDTHFVHINKFILQNARKYNYTIVGPYRNRSYILLKPKNWLPNAVLRGYSS